MIEKRKRNGRRREKEEKGEREQLRKAQEA